MDCSSVGNVYGLNVSLDAFGYAKISRADIILSTLPNHFRTMLCNVPYIARKSIMQVTTRVGHKRGSCGISYITTQLLD